MVINITREIHRFCDGDTCSGGVLGVVKEAFFEEVTFGP